MPLAQLEAEDYDEFGYFATYAKLAGIPYRGRPLVRRESVNVGPGALSTLIWGNGDPELVFLHGGGQNAHTWDTVAMVLGRPMVAVDLPGHGHSYWRDDQDYSPRSNAVAIATLIGSLAPNAHAVIGMSLGGLTNISLAAAYPQLVRRAIIVDITPSVSQLKLTQQQRGPSSLIFGSRIFESFGAMVDAVSNAAGESPRESLKIGVRHNARRLKGGQWTWRYDVLLDSNSSPPDFSPLWGDLESILSPIMLVRGGASHHVPDEHAEEFRRRCRDVRIEVIPGAGHVVQSHRPVQIAELVESFVFEDRRN
jgi:esterase